MKTYVQLTKKAGKMKIDSKDFRVRPETKVDLSKWPTLVDP